MTADTANESQELSKQKNAQARDFPYYNGDPIALSGLQWGVVLLAVVVAYLSLVWIGQSFSGMLSGVISVSIYAGLPLIALAIVAREHWKALFSKVGVREVLLMVGFAVLNLIVTVAWGSILIRITETSANPVVGSLGEMSTGETIFFFLLTIPQLLGEELMTILPFLAILYLFATRFKMSRTTAIVIAWLLTAVLFAIEHLPTYEWHFLQALLGVGVARIFLTLAYIVTKNLWVSTGAHIINDWVIFGIALLGSNAQST